MLKSWYTLTNNGSLADNFIDTISSNYLQDVNSIVVDGLRLPICSGLDGEYKLITSVTQMF